MIMMVSTVCCRAVACASIIQGSTGTAKILNNLGGGWCTFFSPRPRRDCGGRRGVYFGYVRVYLSIISKYLKSCS